MSQFESGQLLTRLEAPIQMRERGEQCWVRTLGWVCSSAEVPRVHFQWLVSVAELRALEGNCDDFEGNLKGGVWG